LVSALRVAESLLSVKNDNQQAQSGRVARGLLQGCPKCVFGFGQVAALETGCSSLKRSTLDLILRTWREWSGTRNR